MQRRAKDLLVDATLSEQLTLLPERRRLSRPVDTKHLQANIKSTKHALEYACQLADREAKDIYADMGYDASKWSRITSGERDLIGREIPKFNRVIGNSAYLLYLNHLDGFDLSVMRKMPDDKDREIAELKQQLADERSFNRRLVGYTRGEGAI